MAQVSRVTVRYNNPPQEGKKWGSIKGNDGEAFFGPPAILAKFQVGEVCDIAWETFGNGGKKIVKKMDGGIPIDASPWNDENPAPPTPAPQSTVRVPQYAPPAKANGGHMLPKSPQEQEQIWCNAILKCYVELGQIALETVALAQATDIIRDAYKLTFGKKD